MVKFCLFRVTTNSFKSVESPE